jgi:hypothetical protein
MRLTQRVLGLAVGCCAASISGCAIGASLLNPDLLVGFGLDPTTVGGSQGKVLIAYSNSTDQLAIMSAAVIETRNPDGTSEGRTFFVRVDPGETVSDVVECPVYSITAGRLDESGATLPLAAEVNPVVMPVQVNFNGAALLEGFDFLCGDVIEIELFETVTGMDQQQQFAIRVQVLPGQ